MNGSIKWAFTNNSYYLRKYSVKKKDIIILILLVTFLCFFIRKLLSSTIPRPKALNPVNPAKGKNPTIWVNLFNLKFININ